MFSVAPFAVVQPLFHFRAQVANRPVATFTECHWLDVGRSEPPADAGAMGVHFHSQGAEADEPALGTILTGSA